MNPLASATAAWLLTYAVHSTILLGLAWAILRLRGAEPPVADLLWKLALVGGIVTASAQAALDLRPTGSFSVAPAVQPAVDPAVAPSSRRAVEPADDPPVAPSSRRADEPAAQPSSRPAAGPKLDDIPRLVANGEFAEHPSPTGDRGGTKIYRAVQLRPILRSAGRGGAPGQARHVLSAAD